MKPHPIKQEHMTRYKVSLSGDSKAISPFIIVEKDTREEARRQALQLTAFEIQVETLDGGQVTERMFAPSEQVAEKLAESHKGEYIDNSAVAYESDVELSISSISELPPKGEQTIAENRASAQCDLRRRYSE
jgi:hypothetical protein